MRRFFLRVRNVLRPVRAESDLAREIASHLALLEDEFRRRGTGPDARRDLGYAARLLRRHPMLRWPRRCRLRSATAPQLPSSLPQRPASPGSPGSRQTRTSRGHHPDERAVRRQPDFLSELSRHSRTRHDARERVREPGQRWAAGPRRRREPGGRRSRVPYRRACYVPVRRATQIDAMQALRDE